MGFQAIKQTRIGLTFWGFFLWLCATAQLQELPNIEIISERNGLPFNLMSDLVQDKQGFIWISSYDGLARYDGYSFIPFPRKKNLKSKPIFNSITALATNQAGLLWIGQLGGVVSRVNPQTEEVTHFSLEGGKEKAVQAILCDSKGVVWCFVSLDGLYRFERSKFKRVAGLNNLPQKAAALPHVYNAVSVLCEGPDNTIWVGSANGLYRFSASELRFEHISNFGNGLNEPVSITSILPDGEEGVWCASYGHGLIYYDKKLKRHKEYRFENGPSGTNNIIYGLGRKNNNEILLSTNANGLGVFNTITKKFSFYHEGSKAGTGPLSNKMIIDTQNTAWALSDKGLLKWNVSENHFVFNKLEVAHTANHNYYGVDVVFEDSATGRKILGTSYADGVHVIDSTGKEMMISFEPHSAAEPYRIVTDIMRTRDGRIFMTSRDYLFEITPDNQLKKISGPNEILGHERPGYFQRMAQSADGDIWIASSRNGLFHYAAATKSWRRVTAENNLALPDNRIMRVGFDKLNRLWAAHLRSGITRYDPADNSWVHYAHDDNDSTSLVSNLFNDMDITPSGDVWIATLEGLSKYNSQQNNFINYTQRNGLPSQIIYDIASDDDNNLWAMGNSGLMVMSSTGQRIQQFNFQQGIEGMYASFGMHKGTEGKMYACTYRGFFGFKPANVLSYKRGTTDVVLTGIKSGVSTIENSGLLKTVWLSYLNNTITIEFAALNFLGNQNVYRYKMRGLDDNWAETDKPSVTYSGLPSGEFAFEVTLANGKSNTASFAIEVSTPFWKQLWFRLLMLLVGFAGIYGAYSLRTKQILKAEKIKSDFKQQLAEAETKALKAQMSPHFIFNSLNSINRYIVRNESEMASTYLTKFSKLIRLILDNSNQKMISLEQELTALKLYIDLEALRFHEKFTYVIHLKPDVNPIRFSVPPLILQPFVENAIWHGLLHKETPGHLEILIERFETGLKCTITDNGVGRNRANELKSKGVNKEKSYGMQITKNRLDLLKGESNVSTVDIEDLQDSNGNPLGTKVVVKIMNSEQEAEF